MKVSVILVNQDDEELGLLKVERVMMINGIQYASIRDDDGHTFCRVTKNYDDTTRLVDIVDDQEFQEVQKVFKSLGAAN